MNREIIFRGKRTDNGEWVYGYYCKAEMHFRSGDEHFIIEYSCDGLQYHVAPSTVGQFTGMTDKTGKRIFENDIVCSKMKYGKSIGVIVFRNGRFSVDWRVRSEWTGSEISYRTDDLSPADEVVGTIFDNPEFLEVKS